MISHVTFAALLPLLAAAPVATEDSARITGLRIVAGAERTELIIRIEGRTARWDDFALQDPARVVVDLVGVRSDLPAEHFADIDRGGIRAVRVRQPAPDAVRIVVEVERQAHYTVEPVAEGLRLSFPNPDGPFEPWSVGTPLPARVPPAPPPGPRTAAPVPPVPPAAAVHRPERRITVAFVDADIRDVLASFAEFTGRSIVPGTGVTGVVSAEIRDQPWDVALEAILGAHGLAARELPSGIIRVDVLDRLRVHEVQEPLLTETIRINYVPAQELVTALEALRSPRGSIVANPSTNMLIVTDAAAVVDHIRGMIRQLDVRTPQVAIRAKIVFVNRSRAQELGITYDLKDTGGNQLNRLTPGVDPGTGQLVPVGTSIISLGGNSIAALGNANARILGPTLETMITLVMGRFTLVAFLDALQRTDLSDVQAAPLITTLDNQEAEIWVGERTPIRVIDVGTGAVVGVPGAAPRATAQLVETGIKLRVLPTITGDRRVLLRLHAERSSALPAPGEIGVVFQTQQGTTRLMVNDGETAVIGGLTVNEHFRRLTGIPLLMDIPLLGALFRTTQSFEQKRDLLIMVTPHIVDERP